MNLPKRLLVIAFAVISLATAYAEDSTVTNGKPNGRAWNAWSPDAKAGYIRGYSEGVLIGCAVYAFDMKCVEKAEASFPQRMNFGEIAEAVDQFFADVSNVRIPIRWGVPWVLRKLVGSNVRELEVELSTMRKQWN